MNDEPPIIIAPSLSNPDEWYFWDEDEACGPYEDSTKAHWAAVRYCSWEENPPEIVVQEEPK